MMNFETDWAYLLLHAGIALCAFRVIFIDIRQFEIEFETLGVLAVLALLFSVLHEDMFETGIRLFSGLSFWGICAAINIWGRELARYGAGDPPLIGVMAFMAAPWVVPWALLAGVLSLGFCAYYSHIRGKRLFQSMYPAAPPLVIAGLVSFYLPLGL